MIGMGRMAYTWPKGLVSDVTSIVAMEFYEGGIYMDIMGKLYF
jgi:hypothetical protein